MPRPINPNELEWNSVEVPFAGGLDSSQPSRAVIPPRLIMFENGRFDTGRAGIKKRRGHEEIRVRTTDHLLNVSESAHVGWVYGRGDYDALAGSVEVGVRPDAGVSYGMATRDTESLVWDGFRLFSWPGSNQATAGGWQSPVSAVMPACTSTPINKYPRAQKMADMGIANGIAVVAWIDDDSANNDVYISVYDPDTWAPRLLNNSSASRQNAVQLKVIPCGEWCHVLYVNTGNELKMWSIHASSPTTISAGYTDLGVCNTHFDAKKINDDLWAVVKRENATNLAKLTYLNANGTTNTAFCTANTTLATGATQPTTGIAFAAHPTTGHVFLVWGNGTAAYCASYASNGGAASAAITLDSILGQNVQYLAAETTYLPEDGSGISNLYVSFTNKKTYTYEYKRGSPSADLIATRHYAYLASNAFRVGDATYALLRNVYANSDTSKIQYTYFICDSNLKPVGMLERFTAPAIDATGLPSVHFRDGQGLINRTQLYGVLTRRTRVDSTNNNQWDEESLKYVTYDFLPRLRSSQLGRCTYFAGAQLHQYDGRECVEAGFHHAMENVAALVGAAGNLTGTYQYKVRIAYKNAQGEEVEGPALTITSAATTSDKLVLSGYTYQWSRRSGCYYNIYRRTATGTEYFLVSSRDPSTTGSDNGYIANDPTAATWSFTDNLSDTDLIAKEKDRANGGLLEPFSPLACTGIAAGRDRLWLWGGEIEPGSVLPSLLYQPEAGVEVAEFNGFLLTVVDRGIDPLTAFGFMGNSTLAFKKRRIYSFEADGPNNLGSGSFDAPRVIAADTGALTQESVVLTTGGLMFESEAGIQLLATNYFIQDVGQPVQEITGNSTITCAILVSIDQEVRFYREDADALVFNYRNGEWATWTVRATGGVVNPITGLALLCRSDGRMWVETEDVWTDANVTYVFRFQTAWLHAGGLQEFQRVRKLAMLGDLLGETVLTVEVYYDDLPYYEDRWTWAPMSYASTAEDLTFNTSVWGDEHVLEVADPAWGNGLWGQSDVSITELVIYNSVYDFVRRLARQKCSRVSFRFSDNGARTEGPAFTAIALELGRRGGLTRSPARSFD